MFFKIFEKTQPTSLYWFAGQHQASTSRGQNLAFFIQNLVQNLMNLVLRCESDKSLLKLKQSRKPHICGTRRLRVKLLRDSKVTHEVVFKAVIFR